MLADANESKAGKPRGEEAEIETRIYRGNKYRDPGYAAYYHDKHQRTWVRRISNWREKHIVIKALSSLAPMESLLDLPCGAGRFLPALVGFGARILAADRSAEMLKQGMRYDRMFRRRPVRFVSCATQIPLSAGAVDVILCARLIHHLESRESRGALLRELARVARKGVVISFFDADTYKHRRRVRRAEAKGKSSGRQAVTREEMADEARDAGLEPMKMHALFRGVAEITAAAFRVAP